MDKKLVARIGATIRNLRKRAGLSIGRLAELADMDISYLDNVELGKQDPRVTIVGKVARALGVPPARLFEDSPGAPADADYQIVQQLRALVKRRSKAQKEDLFMILRDLQNPARAKALRLIVRR